MIVKVEPARARRPVDRAEMAMITQYHLWAGLMGLHAAPEAEAYRRSRARETENYLRVAGII